MNAEEDTYSTIFGSLKHPIRRKILRVLSNQSASFTDLQKQINIGSPHLTYHLEGLGNLLMKTEDERYTLSLLGNAAVSTMKQIEEPTSISSPRYSLSKRFSQTSKILMSILVCALVVSFLFNGVFLLRTNDGDAAYTRLEKAYDGLDQAYTSLNKSYNQLLTEYDRLGTSYDQLSNAYDSLNKSYHALMTANQSHDILDANTGAHYATIQEAVNAAETGNTLRVSKGIYYEHLIINKSLSILGAGWQETTIDGSYNGTVVTITADNVIFEGFTVQHGSRFEGRGMVLNHSNNSVIRDNIISLNGVSGVRLSYCFNSTISDNIICSTVGSNVGLVFGNGIELWHSNNNTVRNNIIANCTAAGIDLDTSADNAIFGNTIEKNGARVQVLSSSNNTFYHNNFLNFHAIEPDHFGSNNNSWSTNSQGNYWTDYTGLDDGSGNRTEGDGVGDTNLPWHEIDNYPLTNPVNPVRVFWDNRGFPVYLTSNSTISSFFFDQPNRQMTFNVTQQANSNGYFNVSIPKTLLDRSIDHRWSISVDGTDVTLRAEIVENDVYSIIYLNYTSNHNVQIIGGYVVPEYRTIGIVFFIIILVTTSIIVGKKKLEG